MLCMDLFQYKSWSLTLNYSLGHERFLITFWAKSTFINGTDLKCSKSSFKFGLNYCSCGNRNARKDLVSLARIIVLVEMAKHAVCLPICPSLAQHFPLRTNKQRNGAAGRQALFKSLPLEKYRFL